LLLGSAGNLLRACSTSSPCSQSSSFQVRLKKRSLINVEREGLEE
jgi:hypothetical protein